MAEDVRTTDKGQNWQFRYFLLAPLIVIGCGVLVAFFYYDFNTNKVDTIPWHILSKFEEEDLDGDGVLNLSGSHLAATSLNGVENGTERIHDENVVIRNSDLSLEDLLANQKFNEGEEIIHLKASLIPMDINTMRKSKDEDFLDTETLYHLYGLTTWVAPHIEEADFPAANFSVFLPPAGAEVGGTWKLITTVLAGALSETHLGGDRYVPPHPSNATESLLMYLLSMFHPRPFLHMRFPPRGGMACLRAFNHHFYSIVFRLHPEFQLNESPRFPFWFTPASFVGEIVISKDGSHVHSFSMHVPNDKSTNVDMEWITKLSQDKENADAKVESPGEVDIGHIEEMSIRSTRPSATSKLVDLDDKPLHWSSVIPMDESLQILQKEFYPFTRVPYQHFNKSFALAKSSGRTLRDGPLESLPVMQLLKSHFVSSWSLVVDLEDIVAQSDDLSLVKNAQTALDEYRFPVQISVFLPDGTLVAGLNANDLLDGVASSIPDESSNEDPFTARYLEFLHDAHQKAIHLLNDD